MQVTFFEEIKAYVGFGETDSERLHEFLPHAEPHLERFAVRFYDAILRHPSAAAAISGGTPQVERLKGTLREWMRSGLEGPHDEAFYERRARIGRMHVQIRLPQHYMFTAMNLIRLDFRHMALVSWSEDLDRAHALCDSLDRLFDLELAIMLQTYREDSDARLRASERLATIGQLAASIGHDLRNPLGVIESSLFLVRRRLGSDPAVERHLAKISAQVENCNHIVTDLLELTRDRPPRLVDVAVAEVAARARDSLDMPTTVALSVEAPPGVLVRADPGLLRQVLVNLIGNAIVALDGRPGTITVRARPEGQGRVRIEVADDGPGFSPEALRRAFEPLFTTHAQGTGLGLAMVKSVIERHGGRASAENRPEGGAVVVVELERGSAT